MTPRQLAARVKATGSHFFDADTLRFFGDSYPNYKVTGPVLVTKWSGGTAEVWELARLRPVNGGLSHSAFFDCASFARVFPSKEQP